MSMSSLAIALRKRWAAWAANPRTVTAAVLIAILAAAHGTIALAPSVFEPLQAQTIDRLFLWRSQFAALRPAYEGTVFLLPIDDESIQMQEGYYLGREDYAQLVQSLARAGVSAQCLDVIFAAPESEAGDRALAQAVAEAGNVYLGMAVGLSAIGEPAAGEPLGPLHQELLARQRFRPRVRGAADGIPAATRWFLTLPEIAAPARGLGFLDLIQDRDGAFRRVPLLARAGDDFVASMPLVVLADLLGVDLDDVVLEPGRRLTLPGARGPGSAPARDLVIPIDERGRMIVNFIGPWDSLPTYPYATIHEAAGDRFMMEDLREELRGRVAVVTWFSTGHGDTGAVPTDPHYPRGGIWASAMNTIVAGEFIRELGGAAMLAWIEIPLAVLLFVAAIRTSTVRYVALALGACLAYLVLVAAAFVGANLILNVPGPVLLLAVSTPTIAAYQYHLEAQARAKLRRELAVAREIQIGTLPRAMPEVPGYDLAGASMPADETGGDSFDVIPMNAGRLMLLLGDATGHGIGPALSVTQLRAMLRVAVRLEAGLDRIITHVNDQLFEDLAANRFITAFLGVFDTDAHRVEYHAAGQGPLLHFHAASGACDWLGVSALALGMFGGLPPKAPLSLTLEPGDILGLMTDGVFEQQNGAETPFGEERVAELVRAGREKPMADLCATIFRELQAFRGRTPQSDDVTVLLVRRLPE